MAKRNLRDVAASIRQRLQNNARSTGRPFDEVLQYYAMERFLYRLARSPHADKFVLKGALMLTAWRAPTTRPTRDIDLLGHMTNSVAAVSDTIRAVCTQPIEPDGLTFDPRTITGHVIKEDADYEGVRLTFRGHLQNSRLAMQIDVGFGDVVVPAASMTEYPTVLDSEPPQLRGYTRETTTAEKFEAMVKLGPFNSRMKDFFDIWLLSRQFDFDGPLLAQAVQQTFANRGTGMVTDPIAFTRAFSSEPTKQAQWKAFLRKSRIDVAPASFDHVVAAVADFLRPIAEALAQSRAFLRVWRSPGPWR